MGKFPDGFVPSDGKFPADFTPEEPSFPSAFKPADTSKVTFNHAYDEDIYHAAHGANIDPNLLRGVGEQETGLGTSALYDPKTGVSRTPGNAGHGIFQLDPASGASAADLQRAAKDPAFAAQRAAQMLADNLKRYGTVRRALAAYNAGSPDSPVGLAYADQVLGRMRKLDPIRIAEAAPKPNAPPMHRALAGIDLKGAETAGQKIEHVLNHNYVTGKEHTDWIRRNPVEALSNALGSLQRPVDQMIVDLHDGGWRNPNKVLHNALLAVQRPEDNQKIVNALESAIAHDFGFSHADPAHLHGIGKFLADLGTETLSDPLTYIPGVDLFSVGSKAFKLLGAAVHSKEAVSALLKTMGPVAQSEPVRKLLSNLDKWHGASVSLAQKTNKMVQQIGSRRVELDKTMTPTGKMARMAVENVSRFHYARRAEEGAQLLRQHETELKSLKYGDTVPPKIQRFQLMEAWKYGDAQARSEAEDLLNVIHMPPTDAERKLFPQPKGYLHYEGPLQDNYVSKIIPKGKHAKGFDAETTKGIEYIKAAGKDVKMPFTKPVTEKIEPALAKLSMYDLVKHRMAIGNAVVKRQQIAHETANLYRQYGGTVMKVDPIVADDVLPEWFAKNVPDQAGEYKLHLGGADVSGGFRKLSDTFRLGILGNPFPHGLVNVGAVTMFRSNPYVAGRGLWYGLRGTPKALDQRLEAMGGKTSYWRDPSMVPFVVPAMFEKSQQLLDRLETGYRASYLQYLDQSMHVLPKDDPQFLLNELLKGQKLNLDIGDYHNPTQLVSSLKALGGLYDVFRLDVVPRAGYHALTHTPVGQTLNLAARGQEEFSQDFMPQGDKLEMVGPLDDFSKVATGAGIPDYVTSTATLGPAIGGLVDAKAKEQGTYVSNLLDDTKWILNYIIPGAGSGLKLLDKRNDAPGWVKFWLEALAGGYTKKEPTGRSERLRHKRYIKAENR